LWREDGQRQEKGNATQKSKHKYLRIFFKSQPILISISLVNQNLANSVALATNGLILGLPSFLPQVNWGAPVQFVQDTPEVFEAKLAFFRAFYEAFFRSS
jgi:hypothetical protein